MEGESFLETHSFNLRDKIISTSLCTKLTWIITRILGADLDGGDRLPVAAGHGTPIAVTVDRGIRRVHAVIFVNNKLMCVIILGTIWLFYKHKDKYVNN